MREEGKEEEKGVRGKERKRQEKVERKIGTGRESVYVCVGEWERDRSHWEKKGRADGEDKKREMEER